MKVPLHNNCDAKVFTIEEGPTQEERSEEKLKRMAVHLKIFKWFIAINVLILLIFCGYALCSLYELESVMHSKNTNDLSRYLTRYDFGKNITQENESNIMTEFHEWRKSLPYNFQENQNGNSSYNLKYLLHSITSMVKNFMESGNFDQKQNIGIDKIVNLTNNKLLISNLTDFELHILKEFTKLKMKKNKSRVSRTIKGGEDESKCDLQFTFGMSNNNKPVRLAIKPAKKGEGMINITNIVTYPKQNPIVRECSFNIFYIPDDPVAKQPDDDD